MTCETSETKKSKLCCGLWVSYGEEETCCDCGYRPGRTIIMTSTTASHQRQMRRLGVLTVIGFALAGVLSLIAGLRNPGALTPGLFFLAAAGFRFATL